MRDIFNSVLFIMFLIIIFFLLSSNDIHNNITQMSPRYSNDLEYNRNRQNINHNIFRNQNDPIFISPNMVKYTEDVLPAHALPLQNQYSIFQTSQNYNSVIRNDDKNALSNNYKNSRFSPTETVRSPSLFDVNVSLNKNQEKNTYEYSSDSFDEIPIQKTPENIEKIEYKFNENGRKFRSIGEKLCCKILEEYLGRRVLNNIRPNFMKNPATKRNLELDVYDPITKIAIEYNGIQHGDDEDENEGKEESFIAFGMSEQDFKNQKSRDKLKVKLCIDEGVKLIVVSYKIDSVCSIKKDGKKKYSYGPPEVREKLLYNYIIPKIELLLKK